MVSAFFIRRLLFTPAFFMRRLFLCAGFFYAPAFFMRRPFYAPVILCAGLFCAGLFYAPAFFMRRSFLCAGLFYAPAFFMLWLFYAPPFFMCRSFLCSDVFLCLKADFFICLIVYVGALDILVLSTILYLPSKQTLSCILPFCRQTRNYGRTPTILSRFSLLSFRFCICRVKRLWCLKLVRY